MPDLQAYRRGLDTSSARCRHLVSADFAELRVKANLKLFDRRTECIEWHPTIPFALTAASHGGDIYFLRNAHSSSEFDEAKCALDLNRVREGKGAGGCILSLRYASCQFVCIDSIQSDTEVLI
jgi:hypothetical protein